MAHWPARKPPFPRRCPTTRNCARRSRALSGRRLQKAYDLFRLNFGRSASPRRLCVLAGIALFELGKYAAALQYSSPRPVADHAVNWNISFLARPHASEARRARAGAALAELAYGQAPLQQEYFDLAKALRLSHTGRRQRSTG